MVELAEFELVGSDHLGQLFEPVVVEESIRINILQIKSKTYSRNYVRMYIYILVQGHSNSNLHAPTYIACVLI